MNIGISYTVHATSFSNCTVRILLTYELMFQNWAFSCFTIVNGITRTNIGLIYFINVVNISFKISLIINLNQFSIIRILRIPNLTNPTHPHANVYQLSISKRGISCGENKTIIFTIDKLNISEGCTNRDFSYARQNSSVKCCKHFLYFLHLWIPNNLLSIPAEEIGGAAFQWVNPQPTKDRCWLNAAPCRETIITILYRVSQKDLL